MQRFLPAEQQKKRSGGTYYRPGAGRIISFTDSCSATIIAEADYEAIGCVFTSEVLSRGGEKGVKFNPRTEPRTRLSIRAALCGASTKSDKAFFFSEVPFHLPRVRLCPSITCT